MNYTVQDLLGMSLAFLFYPLVIVAPGYAVGWAFDLFDFRQRRPAMRGVIGLVLSIGIGPVLFYLPYRLGSVIWAWGVVLAGVAGAGWAVCQGRRYRQRVEKAGRSARVRRLQGWVFALAVAWVALGAVMLVDLQWGQRLYFPIPAQDHTTRIAVTDAITRTGVPPVNPGYYPGHPVLLTFLYYYWYVPASLIDQIGGRWVDARAAFNASVIWCGLGLMAVIALYLRLRSRRGGAFTWRQTRLGQLLLLVSGLDILPVALLFYAFHALYGIPGLMADIEHWNNQITAWLGAVLWVPHHVAALIACLVGMMIFQASRGDHPKRLKLASAILTGLCFASALGMSVWVTLVFVLFWGLWMFALLFSPSQRWQAGWMLLAGIVALLAALPFIRDTLASGGASAGGPPLAVSIREFGLLGAVTGSSPLVKNLANLLFLPLNYLLELGFYFLAGILWWLNRSLFGWRPEGEAGPRDPYRLAEALLLSSTLLVGSLLKSSLIASNDLGWRSWMAGQFVLLIWGVDLLELLLSGRGLTRSLRISRALVFFCLALGVMTSAADLFLLRTWPMLSDRIEGIQSELSPDLRLGERTFAARQTYDYINANTPVDTILQYNPQVPLDRPVGLYGRRQKAISDTTTYGVSLPVYEATVAEWTAVFDDPSAKWPAADTICRKYGVSLLVARDTDLAWQALLDGGRAPLLRNGYYAVYRCGIGQP